DLTEPDRIVGELLQPGGYLKLVELGLEDCLDGIEAQQVVGYALYMDGRNIKLSYPLEKCEFDVSGRSFHNGRFIQRMREKAASLPNVKLEQGTVTSLLEEHGTIKGVCYKAKDGQVMTAHAPLTIVCDGCFSNLRRALCKPKVEVPSCFVGMVLKNVDLPYANHGHVLLVDPSPILFYPISNTEVRCLVDIPGQKLPSIANGEMTNYLKTFVAPQIPTKLYDAFVAEVDKGNIRTMPNRSMPANPQPTPGALLIGDAFNMRHPLTGGGMTVALSDIVLLRDLLRPLRNLNDAPTLCRVRQMFFPATVPAYYKAPRSYSKTRRKSKDIHRNRINNGFKLTDTDGAADVIIVGAVNLHDHNNWQHNKRISRQTKPTPNSLGNKKAKQTFYPKLKYAQRPSQPNRLDEGGVEEALFMSLNMIYIKALDLNLNRMDDECMDLTEPDRIVGELLQPGGYLKLVELGLEGKVQFLLNCLDGIEAQQKFSQWTIYSTDEEESCIASEVEVPSCFVGMVLKNVDLPYANHGHVMLVDPSPILFYPISNTEVRCLVDIPGQKLPSIANGEMTNYLKNFVAPQAAFGIILPIIKAEGVRQMFFPVTIPAYYKAPRVLKT
ncbi:hypothetical protein M8C21_026855, partial [Ambrosia artemisiifolia]